MASNSAFFKNIKTGIVTALFICCYSLLACSVQLKEEDKAYVLDPEMQMQIDPCFVFQNYIYSIREGATPATNEKGSGGCGCN